MNLQEINTRLFSSLIVIDSLNGVVLQFINVRHPIVFFFQEFNPTSIPHTTLHVLEYMFPILNICLGKNLFAIIYAC